MARILLAFIICLASFSFPAAAAEEKGDPFHVTGLKLPRFASLRAEEAYVRSGPGARFPVKWEYRMPGLPVEIILEYENWRKIRDMDGAVGWIHQSLLAGKRTALVSGEKLAPVYQKPSKDSRLAAQVEPKTIVQIKSCDGAWCKVNALGYKGWIEQGSLWGVYKDEKVE